VAKALEIARRDDDPLHRSLRKMLEAGASLGGAGTGAGIGTIIAGPAGTIVGAGAGWAAEKLMAVAGEMALRHLAPRAQVRVGRVVLLAHDEISARIMNGEQPRDELRDDVMPGRSPAEELVEAVLKASADTHEERKLPYLAHLLAAIAFEADLTPAHENQLISIADGLTYRQLVELAVYAEITSPYRDPDFWGECRSGLREESAELRSLRIDLLDLFHRGLVRVSKRERSVRKEKPYRPPTTRRRTFSRFPQHEYVKEELPWPAIPDEVSPRATRLTDDGARLARVMRLDEIPPEEREQLFLAYVRSSSSDEGRRSEQSQWSVPGSNR
jgi:hypothetical protein